MEAQLLAQAVTERRGPTSTSGMAWDAVKQLELSTFAKENQAVHFQITFPSKLLSENSWFIQPNSFILQMYKIWPLWDETGLAVCLFGSPGRENISLGDELTVMALGKAFPGLKAAPALRPGSRWCPIKELCWFPNTSVPSAAGRPPPCAPPASGQAHGAWDMPVMSAGSCKNKALLQQKVSRQQYDLKDKLSFLLFYEPKSLHLSMVLQVKCRE